MKTLAKNLQNGYYKWRNKEKNYAWKFIDRNYASRNIHFARRHSRNVRRLDCLFR